MALLTIVPAVLVLCSLVLVICRSLNYSPKPFLLTVAICANSGAIVTFASGLPNIMIGTSAPIPYMHFLRVSAPYALVSLLIAMASCVGFPTRLALAPGCPAASFPGEEDRRV